MPEPEFADDAERLALFDPRSMPSTALIWPTVCLRKPRLIGNQTRKSLASIITGALAGGRRRALRLGGEQMLGIGVLRRGEDLARAAPLDDLAIGHDADPVGQVAHDAEIVGDQHHGHVELGFELEQKLQDLRLDGHVERRGRLVGDKQVGVVGERHGDHHALPLAARELMRIGRRAALADPRMPPLASSRSSTRSRAAPIGQPAMDLQQFADLVADGVEPD